MSPQEVVSGQELRAPVERGVEILLDPLITISEPPFLLTRSHFYILKSREKPLSSWSLNTLFITTGFILPLIAKYFQSQLLAKKVAIELWEYIVVIVGLFASLVLFIISCCVTTDKKKLMKAIKEHYENCKTEVRSAAKK